MNQLQALQYKALLQTAVLLQVAKVLNEYYEQESQQTEIECTETFIIEEQPIMLIGENMPNDRETLNLVLHEYMTPIAHTDPSGEIIFTLIATFVIGAVIAGGVSVGVQIATVGWDNVDWGVVGIDALFGGVNGLLMLSGIGIVGQMTLGGLLSMGNYMSVAGYRGDEITQFGIFASFGVGFVAGAIRGDGLMKGKYNMVNGLEKSMLQAFKNQGIKAGIQHFGSNLGRHFGVVAFRQVIQSSAYQFIGKTAMYWGKKVTGMNVLYGW